MVAARATPYHHGDLRRALLAAAEEVIAEVGPAAVSLREVARRAGVSHAAPAHHFGDKTGLLTALAVDGYTRFADALAGATDFVEAGVAYVRFALENRAVFEVMFRPELLRFEEPELQQAASRASGLLFEGAAEVTRQAGGDPVVLAVASWSIVHGLATLWLNGNLAVFGQDFDPLELARRVLLEPPPL